MQHRLTEESRAATPFWAHRSADIRHKFLCVIDTNIFLKAITFRKRIKFMNYPIRDPVDQWVSFDLSRKSVNKNKNITNIEDMAEIHMYAFEGLIFLFLCKNIRDKEGHQQLKEVLLNA